MQAKKAEVCAVKRKPILLLVLAALCTALTTVATMVIQIPSPMSGYVNLGDCMVLLSAWLLGPFVGAAAAGVGSMLADVITGYAYYAPGTLVIKAAMALAAGLIFYAVAGKGARGARALAARLSGALVAEAIMVLGYFVYAGAILGNGLSAAASIPGNLVQAVFGLAAALILVQILEKAKALPQV